jgi:pyruvate ferredoxin oxidoreductase alpha subunit
VLDPAHPVTIGAMVGPEAFMEVKYLQHHKQLEALAVIPRLADEFRKAFGRNSGGLLRTYRTEGAENIVVALGSVNGTIQDVVDGMRSQGHSIGSVSIGSFRPFPLAALREVAQHARRVVVIEKDLAVGVGGIVAMDVRKSLAGLPAPVYTVIAGLGGRSITCESLQSLLERAATDELEPVTFLDLNWSVVRRQLDRESAARRSGPAAENILKDIGAIAAGLH